MPYKDPEKARLNHELTQRRYRQKRTAKRVESVLQEIAARPPLPFDELAWAAGMFEGEGTATISSSGKRGHGVAVVTLANTDRSITDFFHERWGGNISVRAATDRHKQAWYWRVQGNKAMAFCMDVAPHLRSEKADRVALLIESQRARLTRGVTHEEHKTLMDGYRNKMREMNMKGPR